MATFNLKDELRKVVMVGIGAAATTVEKSKELIDYLVEKGEITTEQGKVMNEELKRDFKSKMKETRTNSKKDTEEFLDKIDSFTSEQIAALKARLAKVEKAMAEDEKPEDVDVEDVDVEDVEDVDETKEEEEHLDE